MIWVIDDLMLKCSLIMRVPCLMIRCLLVFSSPQQTWHLSLHFTSHRNAKQWKASNIHKKANFSFFSSITSFKWLQLMKPKQLDRCDKKGRHHLCLYVFWEIVVFRKNKPFNQVHVDAYVHPGLGNCSISPDLLWKMSVYLIFYVEMVNSISRTRSFYLPKSQPLMDLTYSL